MTKARWIVVCDGCGSTQRHVFPAMHRRSATFACPSCGPLDVDTSVWIIPKSRNARERWRLTWTAEADGGGGLWQTIRGRPART